MYEEINISVEATSDAKVLIISVAARLAGMHPQTLRQYDRLGLVQAGRAGGGGVVDGGPVTWWVAVFAYLCGFVMPLAREEAHFEDISYSELKYNFWVL